MMLTDSLCGPSRVGNRSAYVLRAFAVIGLLILSSPALSAATLTATWDRNSETNIAGYILSYGTQSGTYTTSIDVGNVTTTQVVLNPGQRYYFVVQAKNTSGQMSPRSAEVFVDVGVGPAPSITTRSPTSRDASGRSVTISGANFGATQGDEHGHASTAPSRRRRRGRRRVSSCRSRRARRPGHVVVTGRGRRRATAWRSRWWDRAPSITSRSPTVGQVGTTVTISGREFRGDAGHRAARSRFNGHHSRRRRRGRRRVSSCGADGRDDREHRRHRRRRRQHRRRLHGGGTGAEHHEPVADGREASGRR